MTDYFAQLARTLQGLDDAQLGALLAFVQRTHERGGTLWLAGNGGSASVAAHWACDLSKAAGVRAQALGANGAVLTAFSNDESYAAALAEELRRLARDGDALICLSCSGTSPNMTRALRQAWLLKMPRALITARGRAIAQPLDVIVEVPADNYGVLEDTFAAIGHWLTGVSR